ncbi:nudix hydrolase [Escherichia coli DEC15A]|nr:nudix hydrolase [Escherichia coli DEC15A]
MLLPSGESVQAEERFFVVKITNTEISKEGWSQNEKTLSTGIIGGLKLNSKILKKRFIH